MSEELHNYRAQKTLPAFDFDAFVAEARKAREFAKENGDVMVVWNPQNSIPYRHIRLWLARELSEYSKAPFSIIITGDDKVQLWSSYLDCWSRELVDAIFASEGVYQATPSDADPPADPVPTPMHQPVPVPVPELDWQKDQKSQQDLIEQNQKTREEIKRILGQ